MQKKMNELPEGDWLCEECKVKEETGNPNADKSETEAEPLKVQPSAKNNHQTNIRVLESSGVSTRRDDANNISFLLREDSFSCMVADKAKHVKPVLSCGRQSVNSSLARFQTFSGPYTSKMLDLLQSSQGTLIKVGSFKNTSMKHKDQFLDNIPRKQNVGRQCINTKKGHAKKMSESAPMKNYGSICSNAESTTKLQSLQPLLAEDHRGLKENLHPKADPEGGGILSESKVLDINEGSHDRDYSVAYYGLNALGRPVMIVNCLRVATLFWSKALRPTGATIAEARQAFKSLMGGDFQTSIVEPLCTIFAEGV